MGRIRTTRIKTLGMSLLEKYPDEFCDDFRKNKEILDGLLNAESKKIRNVLAGYITHLVRKRESLHMIKVSYQMRDINKKKRKKRKKK